MKPLKFWKESREWGNEQPVSRPFSRNKRPCAQKERPEKLPPGSSAAGVEEKKGCMISMGVMQNHDGAPQKNFKNFFEK